VTLDATIVITATIAALPPTILALATWRQSRKNTEKADTIISKAEEIHTLTNSNLAEVKAELATANGKIEGVEKVIAALAVAATANQAAAHAAALSGVPLPQKLPNPRRRSK
jgi:hypothetical protein